MDKQYENVLLDEIRKRDKKIERLLLFIRILVVVIWFLVCMIIL